MAYDKFKIDYSEVSKARDFIKSISPKEYEQKVKNLSNIHYAEIITLANTWVDRKNTEANGVDGR